MRNKEKKKAKSLEKNQGKKLVESVTIRARKAQLHNLKEKKGNLRKELTKDDISKEYECKLKEEIRMVNKKISDIENNL